MAQCVAVCCSVACCSVMQRSVLQCVAGSVLQRSVLRCDTSCLGKSAVPLGDSTTSCHISEHVTVHILHICKRVTSRMCPIHTQRYSTGDPPTSCHICEHVTSHVCQICKRVTSHICLLTRNGTPRGTHHPHVTYVTTSCYTYFTCVNDSRH